MENILLRVESRLDDLTKAFHQLKSENEILRKEIVGVSSSRNSETMGLMETRTLREIVEQTEFFAKRINDNILRKEIENENPWKSKCEDEVKAVVKEESDSESSEEFEVVQIRSKSQTEEIEFLKECFNKLIKKKTVKDGKSLRGTSVQRISSSIPFSRFVEASCTIKLTNFLDSDLTDPQYHFWGCSKTRGPLKVNGGFSEVFSFKGDEFCCFFLSSFAISRVLRLVLRCYSDFKGEISLGIGFTPADVSAGETLDDALYKMSIVPDVWIHSNIPLELFVTHGNLLMRGHMDIGPRSIVHVEILECNPMFGSPCSVSGRKKRLVDGKSVGMIRSPHNSRTNLFRKIERFSCVVETANCLGVPLNNCNSWCCNSGANNCLPLKILPLHRESIFASDETNLEAMISYDIISTDLALVIALKVGSGDNSFAAAFVQSPAVTGKKELEALMDENQWKTHDYWKYSEASEGTQLIAIRNIRAEILMTEEEKSVLKIQIFAV